MKETRAEHGKSAEQTNFIKILRSHGKLLDELTRLLKPYGLSEPQYNVLRILRGAGQDGLSCQEIAKRMITRLPDITRMLDRLERAGWVMRKRSGKDRRIVRTMLLAKRQATLAELDEPVLDLHARQFACFDSGELAELNKLLSKILDTSIT
jgi:DNA-binding MarR family transcriptional regulator